MAVRSTLPVAVAAAAVAVVFFFSLELAVGRTPSATLPENESSTADSNSLAVPTADLTPVFRLPIETANDEQPHTQPDPPDASDWQQSGDNQNPELGNPITVRSVPLTLLRFNNVRPMNRHLFPARSEFPIREHRHIYPNPHHHHHHHHHHHLFNQPEDVLRYVDDDAENHPADFIRYVDDAVEPSTEVGESREMETEIETESDPVDPVDNLPHHHSHHHHYHHHHHHHHEVTTGGRQGGFSKYISKHSKHFQIKRRNEEENELEKKNERRTGKGSIVKRIRKFLDI